MRVLYHISPRSFIFLLALLLLKCADGLLNRFQHRALSRSNILKSISDDIFGSEFVYKRFNVTDNDDRVVTTLQMNGDKKETKLLSPDRRAKIMQSYDSARTTFIADSLFISAVGFLLTWLIGSFQDAYSYGIGSALGVGYAFLLSQYVASIGTGEGSKGGSLRLLPVIVLIVFYGKFRTVVNIIPELLGFFSYQLGSLVQIFNENLYGDDEES